MLLHVGFLVESLAAILTRIRPSVRMDEEVRRERRRPLERLSALFTLQSKHKVSLITKWW